jgi:hypothetical protein
LNGSSLSGLRSSAFFLVPVAAAGAICAVLAGKRLLGADSSGALKRRKYRSMSPSRGGVLERPGEVSELEMDGWSAASKQRAMAMSVGDASPVSPLRYGGDGGVRNLLRCATR